MCEIGRILRESRIARGLDIGDVARRTRIRDYYLRAIEDGNAEILPKVYYKGYLKLYANLLNIDAHMLVTLYEQKQSGTDTQQCLPPSDAPVLCAQPAAPPTAQPSPVTQLEPSV